MPARKTSSTDKKKKTTSKKTTKKTTTSSAKKPKKSTKSNSSQKKPTTSTSKKIRQKSESKLSQIKKESGAIEEKIKSEKPKEEIVEKEVVKKPKKHKLVVSTSPKLEKEPELVDDRPINTDLGFEPIVDRSQIDSQKKFYQELSNQIDQEFLEEGYENSVEPEREVKVKKPVASISLYKKLARLFIVLTAILLLAIVYFSFSKLTIAISPAEEVVNNNVLLDVYNKPDSDSVLSGSVMSITAESEDTFLASGEEIIGEEIAGTVTIINNYSKDQALVATTRLLSPDDKLYRIKDSVNVPAGGSLEVEIYTEEVKPEMAISPTQFIIPGLWSGLQDQIYAKNNETFIYRTKTEKYVRPSDIAQAQQELKNKLINKVRAEAKRMFSDDYEVIYDINTDLTDFDYEVEPGDNVSEFSITAESQVVIIAFLKERARELAYNKLSLLIPADKQIQEFKAEDLTYNLDNYNLKDGVATVKISFSGKMSLKDNAEILDRSQLVNLKREQIEKYLENFPEIDSFELKFFPGFVKSAPSLPEKIEIKID
ncbi:MAG: hypothetical protein K9M44_00715 [Candidatus Pacebacteria bacterium]|nr:hypothetical protein [Candidatus Paceibacterota bacterium]